MKQTLSLGRMAGVPVGVHWSVVAIVALITPGLAAGVLPATQPGLTTAAYWVVALVAAVLFVASLLAHELAHAVVARRFGVRVERITLWLLGGVAELRDEPRTARTELLIAVAGPGTSLACAALFGTAGLGTALVGLPAVITAALFWLGLVNVVLAVFNLLPGAPLDGGRVLRALLWQARGDRDRAAITAAGVGYGLGVLLVFAGAAQLVLTGAWNGLWLALVGWFLTAASTAEQAAARWHARLGDLPVRAAMSTDLVCGRPDESVADFLATSVPGTTHRVFPLRDSAGAPAGVVTLAGLAAVPAAARARTPLARVATRAAATAPPDQALSTLAAVVAAGQPLLVVDGGRLVGLVTSDDLRRAGERSALGLPPQLPIRG